MTDGLRRQMLEELYEYNTVPESRPGDVTVNDVMEMARMKGRDISRSQANIWLRKKAASAGWETEIARVGNRQMRIWRKPQ